jgi:bifunctional enzyme Fae/Hps
MILEKRKKYLQVALNSTLSEAAQIIRTLPQSDRILLEAGTPLIKHYGIDGIKFIKNLRPESYVVADLKAMDRGETEVILAKQGGASGAVALGYAPIETINAFIDSCIKYGLDSMVDMMNVEYPIKILRKLKKQPDVVILHRGVDEETFNRDKPIPYIQINKVRASYDVMIAIAGGDTIREVQRAIFNDANIVVVWKEFYQPSDQTSQIAEEFLKVIK